MQTPLQKQTVIDRLRTITHPELDNNIIDLALVSNISITDTTIFFFITLSNKHSSQFEDLRLTAQRSIEEISDGRKVMVALTAEKERTLPAGSVPSSAMSEKIPAVIPGIKFIVAIASGKGGVGKSTSAINLAMAFLSLNLKVGMLDADIHGPSLPHLLGVSEKPSIVGNLIQPIIRFGLKAMSTGFLTDDKTPVIWRGPMMSSALVQMLFQVEWGDLDILIIDMPPGTGDIPLTLARKVHLSGVVIISTPQDLALVDARKGLNMFRRLEVPVLGLVENMSFFIAPDTQKCYDIFGHGGAEKEASQLGIPFLGGVPLEIETRQLSDQGTPVVIARPDSPQTQIYCNIAAKIWLALEKNPVI